MSLRSPSAARRPALGRLAALTLLVSSLAALGAGPQLAKKDSPPTRGLLTLYANDALASSLSLRDGGHGGRIVEGEVALDRAQLAYGVFAPGLLSFGFASDEVVNVVDLGAAKVVPQTLASDASLKFPISVFHTLGVSGRRLAFTEPGGSNATLSAGQRIFGVIPAGLRHLEPEVGHCLVVRYQRTRGDRTDYIAKVEIVDHRPGESITLRWALIGAL